MALTTLGSKSTGNIVKIKENGIAQDFFVAAHNYESALNGLGRTLLVHTEGYKLGQWNASGINTYATSTIDEDINNSYLASLEPDARTAIGTTEFYIVPGNGDDKITTLRRSIFILSAKECGITDAYMKALGTELPVAALLKIATYNGSAINQWTRSARSSAASAAFCINAAGKKESTFVNDTGKCYRPIFTMPASTMVDENGNITFNAPPTITYPGSTTLSDQPTGFAADYTVDDADGDTVTVTERLNGDILRTYTPTLGATQQVTAVLPANYQTILNGQHTISITATDGTAEASPVTITFSKSVYTCSITFLPPKPSTERPSVVRLGFAGLIPDDTEWTAEVCNNAFDVNPIWENAKFCVKRGYNFVFQNKIKTADKWGVNLRIMFSRGLSNAGGFIDSLAGGFKTGEI